MKILCKDNYSTKDLGEAAFLYTSGKKLVQAENDNGVFWFIFTDKESCKEMSDSFWSKEAIINAREFCNSLRTLKDLIFNKARR